MSDEGMSDAELHKLVSCDHDKGCGMRYAACSCGYEKALESALPLLLARATAAERERDALREALQGMVRGCDYSHFNDAELAAEAERYPSDWIDLITDARAALTANHSAPVVEE